MLTKIKNKALLKGLFAVYLLALFWIILLKLNLSMIQLGSQRSINLIPFAASALVNGHIDWWEPLLNVVAFIPLGVYTAILYKRRRIRLIVATSVFCEVTQFILGIGASDITDVITNTVGGLIGLLVYHLIEIWLQHSHNTQKIINRIAVVGTVLCATVLVLVKVRLI
ncbi:VanZ family protein [Loigolactobacillus jiayinensis]|uniref:VanZ family protein n=1 Tax=Loigolactobacillus jiayinensis TaxID=2486016 RepID=A0ABW1RGB2_9LACO|nr:VanZ family protein [Loigolactobacillus jiayinensis]